MDSPDMWGRTHTIHNPYTIRPPAKKGVDRIEEEVTLLVVGGSVAAHGVLLPPQPS